MKIYVKKIVSYLFAFAIVFTAFGIAADAQEMMKKEMAKDARPTVAIIRAGWCPACRKLEPTMAKLMKEYGGKLNFVVMDVTDDKTSAEALKIARNNGLEEFFNQHKTKTSTVAIFKDEKQLFKTDHNYERANYVKEFDKALK